MNTQKHNQIYILLVLLVAAALLSGCAKSQAAASAPIADKIAKYTLPDGYREQFSLDLMDYQLVSLTGATENCHIYLVQAPKDTQVNIEKMQEQARYMDAKHPASRSHNLKVVETRTVSLRGKSVPLLVGEGINSENKPYREVTALFDGRGGPALVSISSPVDLWNWDQVNGFLASIE